LDRTFEHQLAVERRKNTELSAQRDEVQKKFDKLEQHIAVSKKTLHLFSEKKKKKI